MMLRIFIATFFVFCISPASWAVCTLMEGQPTSLSVPSQIIKIAADAPISNTTPIAGAIYTTPTLGAKIKYNLCEINEAYGKSVNGLIVQDSGQKLFKTNIPGISIKPRFNNTAAYGNFPTISKMTFSADVPPEMRAFSFEPGYFYQVEFYKTGPIKLSDPQTGDLVLGSGMIGYNWITSDSPANAALSLIIGDIRIISTPVCTVSGEKNINFDTVTPSQLKAGVIRPLDFSINCTSDYGTYSAKAAITTNMPSADASYIQAEDAAGNKDRLAIYITDSTNRAMKVDGSTSEQKSSVSEGAAEFNWSAKLLPGSSPSPTGGTLTAKAEIIFDIQ